MSPTLQDFQGLCAKLRKQPLHAREMEAKRLAEIASRAAYDAVFAALAGASPAAAAPAAAPPAAAAAAGTTKSLKGQRVLFRFKILGENRTEAFAGTVVLCTKRAARVRFDDGELFTVRSPLLAPRRAPPHRPCRQMDLSDKAERALLATAREAFLKPKRVEAPMMLV